MTADVLADYGYLFLGSRLKRLAERFQTDAAAAVREAGLPVQPAQFPLLAAIEAQGPMTVSQAVRVLGLRQPTVTRMVSALTEAGLLTARRSADDQRVKTLALTDEGRQVLAEARDRLWPHIDSVVAALCSDLSGDLLSQLSALEERLDQRGFADRVRDRRPSDGVRIVEYRDDLAEAFYRINAEWVAEMFTLEENDVRLLSDPRGEIVNHGGIVLFAEVPGHGVVGTCALMKMGDGCFELTKMAVLRAARGHKAGEALLRATLDRAATLGAETVYLLTNWKCAAAIHLYEKAGFVHDAGIMERFGSRYERCNVAMLYKG